MGKIDDSAEKIIKELPKGIISWYSFKENCDILYFGSENDAVADYLKTLCTKTLTFCTDIEKVSGNFDYIIITSDFEKEGEPAFFLKNCNEFLKDTGKILLFLNNRLGINYFCGERDPHTNRNFDGIENYRRAQDFADEKRGARCYSKAEIVDILNGASLDSFRFYSVFPSLQMPQLIYSEEYLPQEALSGRYFPKYQSPNTVFLEEEFLLADLIKNGIFHTMANAFIIEVAKNGDFSNIISATVSTDRGEDKALATIIKSDSTVEKRAIYKAGVSRLYALNENAQYLAERGFSVVKGEISGASYTMPFIEGVSLVERMCELFFEDKEKFIEEMDSYRELILTSSKHVGIDEELGVILERCFVDLVPHNCIQTEKGLVFYDQEEYIENLPANLILFRSIQIIYNGNFKLQQQLPIQFFYKRYNLDKNLEDYNKQNFEYLNNLRNLQSLAPYICKHERNANIVNSNRIKLNYSASEYQKIFIDVFRDLEGRKLVLFGSGNFAKRFIALYSKDYDIHCIVDNNSTKWGTKLGEYEIVGPQNLSEFTTGGYKIIVCIKNYIGVSQQLDGLQIKNYCIYDPNISYNRTLEKVVRTNDKSQNKIYNIGYIAGVFDLFHIGHLNLLRRAKEQCNKLIVGVVSDEGVSKYKKTKAFIPFEERIEIVSACKYVDEAVEIPLDFGGSEDAYNLYRFDVQFSGSDYTNDVNWLKQKAFLESQGAELVFFPYTESTSSSKLKAVIDNDISFKETDEAR